jgi:hypothetical protein
MSKFNIGDKVRIKSLDELLKIGKVDQDGDIIFNDFEGVFFENSMIVLCGKETYIKDINESIILSDEGHEDLDWEWCFVDLMLEKI